MAQSKTKPTDTSIDAYLASRASAAQLADAHALMVMLARVTGEQPTMWGPSIVGYGEYRYRYESGRTGTSCLAGFAIRGKEFVIYLSGESDAQALLLVRLGKYKMGKACLYFKCMADVDAIVLSELVANSVASLKLRYPSTLDV